MADLTDAGGDNGVARDDAGAPSRRDGGGNSKEAGSPADGSSVSTKGPVEIVASGFHNPYDLALAEDSVFFTLRQDTISVVRKVPKDGSEENQIVAEYDASAGVNPVGDTVLIADDDVVWMNGAAGGGIYAAPIGGGAVRRIRGPLEKGRRLALHDGLLYFSDEAFRPYAYALQRVQLDGGSLRLVDEYEIRVGGIAVDSSGVYWTTAGALANGKASVRTQPLDAPDASFTRDLFVDPTNRDEMGGLAISSDDVFWAETGRRRVVRVAKGGGPITVLVDGVDQPRRVALDATHVWFTTRTTVSRVPRSGGEIEDFVRAIAEPTGIAVDATHVYWAATGSGEIGRIRK